MNPIHNLARVVIDLVSAAYARGAVGADEAEQLWSRLLAQPARLDLESVMGRMFELIPIPQGQWGFCRGAQDMAKKVTSDFCRHGRPYWSPEGYEFEVTKLCNLRIYNSRVLVSSIVEMLLGPRA